MKQDFGFISSNKEVQEYAQHMFDWIVQETNKTESEIEQLFWESRQRIASLFEPYPEIAFHDEPAKWAELLAISWEIMREPDLKLDEEGHLYWDYQ